MKRVVVLSMTVLFAVSAVSGATLTTAKEHSRIDQQQTKTQRKALRKLEGNTVSAVAKNNFANDFGKASNVQWKRVNTFDEVAFTQDGKAMKAFYDENGVLVGTTQAKAFADLPAKAQQGIKAKYKDYNVSAVILYDDNESNDTDMLLYGQQFDDADSYFVELAKGAQKIVLQVSMDGNVTMFKQM